MASQAYGLNSPETRKAWAPGVFIEALKSSIVGRFIGEDDTNVIQELTDLRKDGEGGKGDRIRTTLRMQLNGAGVQGDNTAEGQEDTFQTHTDDIEINQLREQWRSSGKMSEQRVPFNMREQGRLALKDWWTARFDRSFLLQAAGCNFTDGPLTEFGETYDPADTRYTGNQAIIAPSSGYHFWSEDSTTADEDLDSTGDQMDLAFIDDLVAAAKLTSPMIRPTILDVNGVSEEVYVLVMHPRQTRDLRKRTGDGKWLDIQKAAMQGGDVMNNPIFTGALGVYNNVILHESSRVAPGVNSSTGAAITTVRRAVFLGAQALTLAFGKGSEFGRWNWVEKKFDYDNQLGISAGCVFGMKKNQFDDTDFGCMVLSTYAGVTTGSFS